MQLLDEESLRATELSQRLNDAGLNLDRAWDEQDQVLTELDAAHSRLRFLERAFRERGEIPVGEPQPDDDWLPDSCVEALEAGRELLPFLVFTCGDDSAQELDRHPKQRLWAKKIWSCMRAMNDYARAKAEGRFSGDLARYREDPPPDAVPLICDYTAKESESTGSNPVTRGARTFAISRDVAPDGQIYMEAHVKIDRVGSHAPRIHLIDDTSGSTQRLHVGYVGPHLPTSTPF
jgi:hypothetical protein